MVVECCKTGRWWPAEDGAAVARIVREKGLTDYLVHRRHPATTIGE